MKQLIVFCMIVSGSYVSAQESKVNTLDHLAALMQEKIAKYDVPAKTRMPETFLIFFEIDSIGYVKAIHLMSDEEVRDSSYHAAKRIKPGDLKEWVGVAYASRIIIMPVNTFGKVDNRINGKSIESPRNYLDQGDIPALRESAEWK